MPQSFPGTKHCKYNVWALYWQWSYYHACLVCLRNVNIYTINNYTTITTSALYSPTVLSGKNLIPTFSCFGKLSVVCFQSFLSTLMLYCFNTYHSSLSYGGEERTRKNSFILIIPFIDLKQTLLNGWRFLGKTCIFYHSDPL